VLFVGLYCTFNRAGVYSNWPTDQPTNSMKHSPSWESNSLSACQEIPSEPEGSLLHSQEPATRPYLTLISVYTINTQSKLQECKVIKLPVMQNTTFITYSLPNSDTGLTQSLLVLSLAIDAFCMTEMNPKLKVSNY